MFSSEVPCGLGADAIQEQRSTSLPFSMLAESEAMPGSAFAEPR